MTASAALRRRVWIAAVVCFALLITFDSALAGRRRNKCRSHRRADCQSACYTSYSACSTGCAPSCESVSGCSPCQAGAAAVSEDSGYSVQKPSVLGDPSPSDLPPELPPPPPEAQTQSGASSPRTAPPLPPANLPELPAAPADETTTDEEPAPPAAPDASSPPAAEGSDPASDSENSAPAEAPPSAPPADPAVPPGGDPAIPPPADPTAPPADPAPEANDDPFAPQGAANLPPLRIWTDATGEHHVSARLVESLDGKVRLLKASGRFTTVPVYRLSETDRRYLQEAATGTAAGALLAARGDASSQP